MSDDYVSKNWWDEANDKLEEPFRKIHKKAGDSTMFNLRKYSQVTPTENESTSTIDVAVVNLVNTVKDELEKDLHTPKMMPNQEPYTNEELDSVYKLIDDSAKEDKGESFDVNNKVASNKNYWKNSLPKINQKSCSNGKCKIQ